MKKYEQEHKTDRKAYKREWMRKWRKSHGIEYNEYRREQYASNRESLNKERKEWYAIHREEVTKYMRDRYHKIHDANYKKYLKFEKIAKIEAQKKLFEEVKRDLFY